MTQRLFEGSPVLGPDQATFRGRVVSAAREDGRVAVELDQTLFYPNAGGRFPFSEERCAAINDRLRGQLGPLRRAFPVPGGGIDVRAVPQLIERYGTDVIFLIGGSLYAQADIEQASRSLLQAVRAAAP